jgi:hypothetical protein
VHSAGGTKIEAVVTPQFILRHEIQGFCLGKHKTCWRLARDGQ